jgi:DNA-directed RNA polymerase subunit L
MSEMSVRANSSSSISTNGRSSKSSATKLTPKVSSYTDEADGELKFTLSGVDTSIANGLRRIILTDIRSVVFRSFPHEECKINIITNTSRFNNEMIKQRLSCVPIHITDHDFPIDEHVVELAVQNTEDHTMYVTSGDFMIKNTKTDSYLTKEAVAKIFPADPISGGHIDLVRLRPNIAGKGKGEEISLTAKLDWGTQGENGAFNSVSTCLYANTIDQAAADKKWEAREKEMKSAKNDAGTIQSAKQDYGYLDAFRSFKPNSFDFIIESVGVWKNQEIVRMGCDAMIRRLKEFANAVETQRNELIRESQTTIRNGYDVVMKNEDYTLGKVVEYFLYAEYYAKSGTGGESVLSFCGFAKPHPHINESVIRLATRVPVNDLGDIVRMVVDACDRGVATYEGIREYFR